VTGGQTWYDDEAGPLVRPYAVTGGRTRAASTDLSVITLVVALRPPTDELATTLDTEQLAILEVCARPTTIAEIAAAVRLPLSVVKILVADLIDAGLVLFRSSSTPDIEVLKAVIHGIRRL